ncbi:MAG: hypothetical protein FWH35_10470 [Treponema sp.]|nr:hypothetical protein [Treponema sp.]
MKIYKKVSVVLLVLLLLLRCEKNKGLATEKLMGFYDSLQDRDIISIKEHLESGINPDYSLNRLYLNKLYWEDRNPLWLILSGEYGDVEIDIIRILIDFGANVNLRPYVWHTLDHRILTEDNIEWMNAAKGRFITGTTVDLMYKKIEILLQAGADVDYKGAPNRQLIPATDKNYKKYFEQEGSRPINYAIKKNLPTIVDLLLQYTTLDEESLDTAKLSENPLMIEKINIMWEKQNRNEKH